MTTVNIYASSRYPIRRRKIKDKISEVLAFVKLENDFEVEVTIVGDRKMRELKHAYFGVDESTDVLSFPLHESITNRFGAGPLTSGKNEPSFVDYPDKVTRLGSIVISYPQAQKQANLHKLLIDEEINQLVEHGMWHLLGVHHD